MTAPRLSLFTELVGGALAFLAVGVVLLGWAVVG